MKNTVVLEKDNIEKVLLFDDGLVNHVIYLFKDGTAKSCNMTTDIIAATSKAGIPVISVGSL